MNATAPCICMSCTCMHFAQAHPPMSCITPVEVQYDRCVGISRAKGEGNTTQQCNASPYFTPTGVMIDLLYTSQHKTSRTKWYGKEQEAYHVYRQEWCTSSLVSWLKAQTSYILSCTPFPKLGNALVLESRCTRSTAFSRYHICVWLLHTQSRK